MFLTGGSLDKNLRTHRITARKNARVLLCKTGGSRRVRFQSVGFSPAHPFDGRRYLPNNLSKGDITRTGDVPFFVIFLICALPAGIDKRLQIFRITEKEVV